LKTVHFLPPAAAVILVGVWNSVEQRAISTAKADRTELREKISQALPDAHVAERQLVSTITRAAPTSDWQAAADLLTGERAGDAGKTRERLALREKLSRMTREEILASLDEIEQAGLTTDAKHRLQELLLERLAKLSPSDALERFGDPLADSSSSLFPQFTDALRDWAKRDLPAATAWLDHQLAAGKFETTTLDGKSDALIGYEAALLESMLVSAPEAVAARLAALPEDQRREVLEQIPFQDLAGKAQQAYAALIRELIPADERAGSFAHIASQLVDDKGFDKVSHFLDAVQATPNERAAAASQTAESHLEALDIRGEITRGNVDVLRTWLRRQAPDEVDRITGKALAETSQQSADFDFSQASKMALEYGKASGRDDVVTAFLASYAARSNGEQAAGLADAIADSQLRAEILERLK
jgi:hypothetical protein